MQWICLNTFVVQASLKKHDTILKPKNHTWEVDEFHGRNEGLIVAEIELESEDEQFDIPEWVGKEVSDDPRYYNMNLMTNPYEDWKK